MLIVGLNAYHGDVAAAVLRDGNLIAALEEERFCRIKHVDVWAIARGRRVHLLQKAWFGLTHRPGPRLLGQYRNTAGKQASIPEVIAKTFDLDAARINAR